MDNDNMPTIKKRDSSVASLCNLVSPGLGFLYVGRPIYAVALPLTMWLLLSIAAWTKIIFIPYGVLIMVAAGLVVWLGSVAAAGLLAQRQSAVELLPFQRWYVYIGFVVITSIIGNVLVGNRGALLGYESYRIPSRSMEGTILLGDFFISNAWKYRTQSPQRGELVVFSLPGKPGIKYVKRVIGLPGDHVEIKSGVLSVNGSSLSEPYVNPENNQRSLREDVSYEVPATGYFVMGDNRDHSNDSRYWGPVPEENICGSVEFVWFSFDPASGVRTSRIGQRVN